MLHGRGTRGFAPSRRSLAPARRRVDWDAEGVATRGHEVPKSCFQTGFKRQTIYTLSPKPYTLLLNPGSGVAPQFWAPSPNHTVKILIGREGGAGRTSQRGSRCSEGFRLPAERRAAKSRLLGIWVLGFLRGFRVLGFRVYSFGYKDRGRVCTGFIQVPL